MSLLKKLTIALPAGLLATLETFHASGHHDVVYQALSQGLDRWLVVHYLQLILFPWTAFSVYQLCGFIDARALASSKAKQSEPKLAPSRFSDQLSTRIVGFAMAVYGIGYASYDSIAGIGSGVLVKNSIEMLAVPGAPSDFEEISDVIVQSYYDSALVEAIAFVAIAGAIAGLAITAWKIYSQTAPESRMLPVLMLAGACFGVTRSHAPPWGPITYGFLCVAIVVTLFFSRPAESVPAESVPAAPDSSL